MSGEMSNSVHDFPFSVNILVEMEPTNIFCEGGSGVIYQLWRGNKEKEWRPLPSFSEASQKYDCRKIKIVSTLEIEEHQ